MKFDDKTKQLLLDIFTNLRSGELTSGNPDTRERFINRLAGILGVRPDDNAEQAQAKVFPPRNFRRVKEGEDDDSS